MMLMLIKPCSGSAASFDIILPTSCSAPPLRPFYGRKKKFPLCQTLRPSAQPLIDFQDRFRCYIWSYYFYNDLKERAAGASIANIFETSYFFFIFYVLLLCFWSSLSSLPSLDVGWTFQAQPLAVYLSPLGARACADFHV